MLAGRKTVLLQYSVHRFLQYLDVCLSEIHAATGGTCPHPNRCFSTAPARLVSPQVTARCPLLCELRLGSDRASGTSCVALTTVTLASNALTSIE